MAAPAGGVEPPAAPAALLEAALLLASAGAPARALLGRPGAAQSTISMSSSSPAIPLRAPRTWGTSVFSCVWPAAQLCLCRRSCAGVNLLESIRNLGGCVLEPSGEGSIILPAVKISSLVAPAFRRAPHFGVLVAHPVVLLVALGWGCCTPEWGCILVVGVCGVAGCSARVWVLHFASSARVCSCGSICACPCHAFSIVLVGVESQDVGASEQLRSPCAVFPIVFGARSTARLSDTCRPVTCTTGSASLFAECSLHEVAAVSGVADASFGSMGCIRGAPGDNAPVHTTFGDPIFAAAGSGMARGGAGCMTTHAPTHPLL